MHILPRQIFPLVRRAAPPRRWWLPSIARRESLPMEPPTPSIRRFSRFPHGSRNMASCSGAKVDESAKHESRHLVASVGAIYGDEDACRITTNGQRDAWTEIQEVTDAEEHTKKVTKGVILLCGEGPPSEWSDDEEFERLEAELSNRGCYDPIHLADDVKPMCIFPCSTPRDGFIYRGKHGWKKDYRIADCRETQVEAMMLSDPKDCMFLGETCMRHYPYLMLQFFSFKLVKLVVDGSSVELYGYIAVRDVLDPLLNYVINFRRDDPIIVEQGSLIKMTGPKRGIELCDNVIIEYDMRIKRGGQEKDDLQLIDGATYIDEYNTRTEYAFRRRIHGDCGAVDITVSRLDHAVEATVEVFISEVRNSFDLSVCCFTSGLGEEIRLFDGTIGEAQGLRRSVVAAVMDTWMDLKFKVSSGLSDSGHEAEHLCTFKTINHGYTSQLIKDEFASNLGEGDMVDHSFSPKF